MIKLIWIKWSAFILAGILAHGSCTKEVYTNPDEKEFCDLVKMNALDSSIHIIDEFLNSLDYTVKPDPNNQKENLEKLVQWFNNKSCIKNCILLCDSCIETKPPQSELKLQYQVYGDLHVKILDIWMGDTLRVRTFHD